jgi:hypothetical protein
MALSAAAGESGGIELTRRDRRFFCPPQIDAKMDPVTIALLSGALGGAGGKAVETLWQATGQRWLAKYLDDVSDEARAVGQANTVEFLSQLAIRIGRLEGRVDQQPEDVIRDRLRDPDLLVTFNNALLASARTSNEVKHDVLARAVAERFLAPPDSLSALAANIATEAIPRLSATHLRVLALAAVVYVVRPRGLPLRPDPHSINFTDDEAVLVREYGAWLKEAIEAVVTEEIAFPSDAEYAHLAAAGCITYERGLERNLRHVLYPYRARTLSMAARAMFEREVDAVAWHLNGIWDTGMQQVTLTPPGILIAVAAYDNVRNQDTQVDWSNPNVAQAVPPNDHQVWDGFRIDGDFFRKLGEEIVSSAERGVQPWARLTWHRR